MIRHKGLQSLSSTSVACLRIEGAPKHHIGSLLQTPHVSWSWVATLYVRWGEFSFALFQIQSYPKRWSWIRFLLLLVVSFLRFFSSSLVAFTAVRLSLALFSNSLVVNFFVRCTTICLQVEELATLWISLGRGLGDFDVAHLFHPWTYVSNQITHLFSDGIVSQEMPDVGVKLSARHLAPTRPFERNFGTSVEYC